MLAIFGAVWPKKLRPVPIVHADELWVDLSNHNGPLTVAMVADMKAAGVVGVIIQAITGLNGVSWTRQQLQFALDSGLRIAGYVWGFGDSVDVNARLHMFDGFTLEFLAYDGEDDAMTIGSVDRDLAECDAYLPLPTLTECYSAPWVFIRHGWQNVTRWANRRCWDAIYDGDPNPDDDFVQFGGWTYCFTKQFWDKQLYGDVACDVNSRRVA